MHVKELTTQYIRAQSAKLVGREQKVELDGPHQEGPCKFYQEFALAEFDDCLVAP